MNIMSPQILLGLLLAILNTSPSQARHNKNLGYYIPIGHGACLDSNTSQYPAFRLIKTVYNEDEDPQDTQSFYVAPRDNEGLEHLNSVHRCHDRCSPFETNSMYRGYEIIVGDGCYCLMDYDVYDTDMGSTVRGDGKGMGPILRSDYATVGHYCYAFRRDTSTENGPAPPRPAVAEYTYDPIHLLVGKGICHDNKGRRYPFTLHYTDGSNRRCREKCVLATPMKSYRGYQTFPRDKKCACLFDTSADSVNKHGQRYLQGGDGGEGNIRGVMKPGPNEKDVYCYKYYKVVKKTLGENGKVKIRNIERVETRNTVEESNDPEAMESIYAEEQEATEAKDPLQQHQSKKKHISVGKGLCGDSESRSYIGIPYPQEYSEKMIHDPLDCEALCSQYEHSPYYRGYEAVHTNVACKCLFDDEAKNNLELADLLKSVKRDGGVGEIMSLVAPNEVHECFKYIGGHVNQPQVVIEPGSSSPVSIHHTYELVGEGICIDSVGGWFDAVEFKDTIATDCQGKCQMFTSHPKYRGIEVTLSKVCFCLFDDGTKLDNANVLNYGKGKGEVAGVQKKEGMTGPFCFKYTRAKSDARSAGDKKYNDDEIMQERMLHDEGGKGDKSAAPASQPSSFEDKSTEQSNSVLLTKPPPLTYDSVFVPHQTQYDFLRFDPYSFSGAPLGGWGRDTRNRLASLPIRLVHGFEGNWNDVKSNTADTDATDSSDTDEVEEGNTDAVEMEIGPDGSQQSRDGNLSSKKRIATEASSPPKPPHFIIHDGTGQKYICRVYHDDELVVVSRLDSMFLPAMTVEENGGSPGVFEEEPKAPTQAKTVAKNSINLKIGGDGKSTIKLFSDTFNIDIDGEGDSLMDAISSAVANTLHNLGLDDVGGQNANDETQDINAMLTQIGMQAAVGAGIDGASQVAASAGMVSQQTTARKLTLDEILRALDTMAGTCSQVHLGWWSYEWCHREQVKQFHVGVSQRGANNNAKQLIYEVQDVTLVGQFNGHVEIIYPGGNYASTEDSQGTIITMQRDSSGKIIDSDVRVLSKDENLEWKRSHTDNEVIRRYHKNKSFESRGPIIKHTFQHGDVCDDVGYPRQTSVEIRCCTEDEMLRWMKSKATSMSKNALTTKDIPKAALITVEESKTEICHYTSHVCTPALCSEQDQVTVKPKANVHAGAFQNKEVLNEVMNAFETAGGAIATKLAEILGENLDTSDVEVYMGDENHVGLIEELMNDSTPPTQLKGILNALFNKKSGPKKPPALQMKEGESVRELLSRTLGQKPCLKKNLGWWTYEYCHNTHVVQYHGSDLIDTKTGQTFTKKETTHLLGLHKGSGNSVSDYPNEEEHLHVVNVTDSSSELDLGRSRPKPRGGNAPNQKAAGGNGAVYVQEWSHGDTCDHEDVAESVIKGGNIVEGSVERSTTVRYSCGKTWELVDINEDSTCHYVVDISVPELCQHPLFKAPDIKTQVVKCLPV